MVRSSHLTGVLSRRLDSPAPAPSGRRRVRTGLFFHYKRRFMQEFLGQRWALSIWGDKLVSITPKTLFAKICQN
jgi:hypothetical protein